MLPRPPCPISTRRLPLNLKPWPRCVLEYLSLSANIFGTAGLRALMEAVYSLSLSLSPTVSLLPSLCLSVCLSLSLYIYVNI